MLVAEKKELAAYGAKIFEIWTISRKEGVAKGSMYGAVGLFSSVVISLVSVSIYRLRLAINRSFLWK